MQTLSRERIHLWNSQLDVRPDFCACRIEAWGTWSDDSDTTTLFIRFRLASTFLWLLPSSGFFWVNIEKIMLQNEKRKSVKASWTFKLGANILQKSFMVVKCLLFFPHLWLSFWHSYRCAACFSNQRSRNDLLGHLVPLIANAGLSSCTFVQSAFKIPLKTYCIQIRAQKSLGTGE